MTNDAYALYLSGGVGDLMMQLFCHRVAVGNAPIMAVCAEVQLKTAVAIDDLVRRVYFPEHAPIEVHPIKDEDAATHFQNLSDARRLDADLGPRMFFVGDRVCLSRWVYFTRDYDWFKTTASAWLELYARYNRIDEIVARSLVLSNPAIKQRRMRLSTALDEARPITVNVAIQSNSVPGDFSAMVDNIAAILSRLSKKTTVTMAAHQMKQGLRPDGFERKVDMFQGAFQKLTSIAKVETSTIVDGTFADVIASLEQADLFIAVRSGACDVAAVLGVPQINFYDGLADEKVYRHSATDAAFDLKDGQRGALSFHNVPQRIAGAIQRDLS